MNPIKQQDNWDTMSIYETLTPDKSLVNMTKHRYRGNENPETPAISHWDFIFWTVLFTGQSYSNNFVPLITTVILKIKKKWKNYRLFSIQVATAHAVLTHFKYVIYLTVRNTLEIIRAINFPHLVETAGYQILQAKTMDYYSAMMTRSLTNVTVVIPMFHARRSTKFSSVSLHVSRHEARYFVSH